MTNRVFQVMAFRWMEAGGLSWQQKSELPDPQVDIYGELLLPLEHLPATTSAMTSAEHAVPGVYASFRAWVTAAKEDSQPDTQPSVPSVTTLINLSKNTSYPSISSIRSTYFREEANTPELPPIPLTNPKVSK